MQTKINERPVIGEELNSILHPSIIIDRTECNDLKATADEYKKNSEQSNERIRILEREIKLKDMTIH